MAKRNLLGNIFHDHVSVTSNWIVLIACVNWFVPWTDLRGALPPGLASCQQLGVSCKQDGPVLGQRQV